MPLARTRSSRSKAAALAAALLFALIFPSAIAMSADPPPFNTTGPDTVTTLTGKQSTLTIEKREYVKEDGTKVKEERLTQTVSKDGEVEYTTTTTWYSEENGDNKLKYRRSETVDGKGNKKTFEQREVTKRVEGGVRTDYYTDDNGKVFYSGYMMHYDKKDKVVKEKEVVVPDKDGFASSKTKYSVLGDGNVLVESFEWHECDGAWFMTSSASAPAPDPIVISPSICSSGYAIGGSVEGQEAAITAVATVMAVPESGQPVEVQIGADGRFDIPAEALRQGLYDMVLKMEDGSMKEMSQMLVLSGSARGGRPTADPPPRIIFAGSTLSMSGSNLSGHEGSSAPLLSFSGDLGFELVEPLSYSDMEAHFKVPEEAQRGEMVVRMITPDGITQGAKANVVSFDLIVPEIIQVGADFYVTARITGLTGDLLKEPFSAIITIGGPAIFIGTDSNRVLVELIQGEAMLKARALSSGQFTLTGEIVSMPVL